MPSNTIPVKWLQDKNGSEFYPVTHKGAVKDDNGNPIAIPEVLDDLNDVIITPVIDNSQTYFENAVQDYDGNWYDAVILGDQVWMAENLRTTHDANGLVLSYCIPNSNESNITTYGLLYTWYTTMNGESSSDTNPSGVQGIAPNGWHIPSSTEWGRMKTWVGQQSEFILNNNSTYIAKALTSNYGWKTSDVAYAVGNNQSSNNATHFNAPPAGYRNGSTNYEFGTQARFWTSKETASINAMASYFLFNSSTSYGLSYSKSHYYSVRCLYNGTVQQFRQAMATKPGINQILKYDGNHWVNTDIDHNFTFDNEVVSTSSATVTFGASQRGTHLIAAQNDLSITFNVNNESDNYLWVVNNNETNAIQIYIYDVLHSGSQVRRIYMPEDDIIIQPGYTCEIGIVYNSVAAFITTRCDLKYHYNGGSST